MGEQDPSSCRVAAAPKTLKRPRSDDGDDGSHPRKSRKLSGNRAEPNYVARFKYVSLAGDEFDLMRCLRNAVAVVFETRPDIYWSFMENMNDSKLAILDGYEVIDKVDILSSGLLQALKHAKDAPKGSTMSLCDSSDGRGSDENGMWKPRRLLIALTPHS